MTANDAPALLTAEVAICPMCNVEPTSFRQIALGYNGPLVSAAETCKACLSRVRDKIATSMGLRPKERALLEKLNENALPKPPGDVR